MIETVFVPYDKTNANESKTDGKSTFGPKKRKNNVY